MVENIRTGLKPLNYLYSCNLFTKVNGNTSISLNFVGFLLTPKNWGRLSASANGFSKLQYVLALVPFLSIKCLIQETYIVFEINFLPFGEGWGGASLC